MIKKNKHEGCKKWMEEVIELNTDFDDDDSRENIEYAEYILEALEKQIPKLIKTNGKYMKNYGIEPCDQVFCPSCGKRIRVKYKGKFCDKCGQKLKWNDANED